MAFQDYFGVPVAIDPTTGRTVPRATFTAHAPDDVALATPLATTDPATGVPVALITNQDGVLPDFRVAGDLPQVNLKSGSHVTRVTSIYGAVLAAGLGAETVQAAIQAAAAAQAAVMPGLHTQTVAGAVTVSVQHEHTYELTAPTAAAVTLDGPAGCQVAVVWAGTAGTLEGVVTAAGGTYVAVRLTAGWKIFTVGGSGDTTAPTPGTLSSSAITSSGFTLTVAGAADIIGLHAQPYSFSTDGGTTWSAYQSSATFVASGLAASTAYSAKHRVRDAAGNVATGTAISVTTASGGDVTPPTPGTVAGSAITSSGFTLTISGASDAGGLHAQPYAFSTDNGVTWSTYQASASLAITGKTASTGYQCKGRVRDAAGNTADTPAQTVTTTSAGASWQTVAKDSFNGTDGTALTAHTSETGGVTYTGSQAGPKILSNKVDIYPYGGDQNAVSSSTTGLGSKFRASLGYVIPATHGDYLRPVSLTVRDGVSAAQGAGQFHAKVGIDLPSANSANGGLSGTTTYDGALTLTPVGGQNLNLVPLSGTLGISVDAGVLSVLINGTVWATVAAPSGCSFGSSVLWAMEPAGLYNGPHWQADDYLVEKYA